MRHTPALTGASSLVIICLVVSCRAQEGTPRERAVGPAVRESPRSPPPQTLRRFEEIRRFPAPEARQGVAVDGRHFYAIGNAHIAKYDRQTGERIAEWKGDPGGPISHLNSCVVVEAGLVCAHSNYPGNPMVSSIETWDPATLRHTASHSLGIMDGSLTWAVRKDGDWWLNFAHYGGSGGTPGKGPEWTTLVQIDDNGTRRAGYVYPSHFIERLAPYSSSGGNWGSDGLLYVTGHEQDEIYVMRVPAMGSVLDWVETVPAPLEGQAWAFDPLDASTIWGIRRSSGEVVVAQLRKVRE